MPKYPKFKKRTLFQWSLLKRTDMQHIFCKAFLVTSLMILPCRFSITTAQVWNVKHLSYFYYFLGLSIIVANNVTEINFLFNFSFQEKKKLMLCKIRFEPSQVSIYIQSNLLFRKIGNTKNKCLTISSRLL